MPGPRITAVAWAVGSRLPHWMREGLCRCLGWLLGWRSVAAVPAWERNVTRLRGHAPTRRERQQFLTNWLRNNLMSLSLGRWSDEDVLGRALISDEDAAKLPASLTDRGLILALPHMGSWDFAGAWCARVDVKVVSVAERLPAGLYERFSKARGDMGMDIYPMGEPGIMKKLGGHIRQRHAVCLLSDRDMSGHGIPVRFGELSTSMPSGPALLARMTGADLRGVLTWFDGERVRMSVSDPIPSGTVKDMVQHLADHFAAGAKAHPTSWLLLRELD